MAFTPIVWRDIGLFTWAFLDCGMIWASNALAEGFLGLRKKIHVIGTYTFGFLRSDSTWGYLCASGLIFMSELFMRPLLLRPARRRHHRQMTSSVGTQCVQLRDGDLLDVNHTLRRPLFHKRRNSWQITSIRQWGGSNSRR